ncbi:MAG TPA: Gfo/Idh/MocA family oxidoreductase [Verrucomicrobiota bacterium]|nr:Gfo/Idh/MocA family oxidoreductase [Verrucomicrobiota bacterium]
MESRIRGGAALGRRSFLKHSALAAAGMAMAESPFVRTAHAAADDPIRIGLIGCGGRGTGAVLDALGAGTKVVYPSSGYHTEDVASGAKITRQNIEVVALCDVFRDKINRCREQLRQLGITVPEALCFDGFDGYKRLLAVPEINYVIQATSPHFRPMHVKAAIEAGKHVFMEKPGAVDGPGVRTLLEAHEMARQKKLGIAAGTQRRHRPSYREAVRRIQEGEIGDVTFLRCYWNGGVIWVIERTAEMSDMEWQLRNWNYFVWGSGDHIVEQHVHNLDVMNWVVGAHPIKATGLGGRQARRHPIHGNIYDHFAVEYEYPSGLRMFGQCRQMDGCEGRVGEYVHGTGGVAQLHDGNNILQPKGKPVWRTRGADDGSPYQAEHQNLIASIRAGNPINEAKNLAESTLTGIMGRESVYTGQTVEWEQVLNSTLRLGPATYAMGALPFPEVPQPGKYKLA